MSWMPAACRLFEFNTVLAVPAPAIKPGTAEDVRNHDLSKSMPALRRLRA